MIERDLILIGDQAWTPEELAELERRRRHDRERYATDPEYRQRRLDITRAWRERNRERHNAYQRAYMREWRERNRERYNAHQREYRREWRARRAA